MIAERTYAQRLEALEMANVVRSERASLKRDLKCSRALPGAILAQPPSWAGTMRVFDLIVAVPKTGQVKATKVLRDCKVSPSKTLGGLTERQRNELLGALGWRS